MTNLGSATFRLEVDSRKFDESIKGAESSATASFKRLAGRARVVGTGLAAAGAVILSGLFGTVKAFATFEQSMAQVQAVSQATTEEFADLNAIAREMGETTVFTASESAAALSFMAMAGLDARQSIAALPAVLNLAAAGQLELATAADIVTNVMAGYGIEAEKVGFATDVLTTGFISANTSLEQIGEAFKLAGPVAKAAGLSFEETAASLAVMGNAGFPGLASWHRPAWRSHAPPEPFWRGGGDHQTLGPRGDGRGGQYQATE